MLLIPAELWLARPKYQPGQHLHQCNSTANPMEFVPIGQGSGRRGYQFGMMSVLGMQKKGGTAPP